MKYIFNGVSDCIDIVLNHVLHTANLPTTFASNIEAIFGSFNFFHVESNALTTLLMIFL